MSDYSFALNLTGNSKTGVMPVSTSDRNTCPNTCPLKDQGCYARFSFLGSFWTRLTNGEVKTSKNYEEFLSAVRALPKGQLWRHNQAGDLIPLSENEPNTIDRYELEQLVNANSGKRGFTYTHYPLLGNEENAISNRYSVAMSNDYGFTINGSTETFEEADELFKLEDIPVVTLLPKGSNKVSYTSMGNKVVKCPADYEKITCAHCGLCAESDRDFIIGFEVHGTGKKKAESLIDKNLIKTVDITDKPL